METLTFNNYHSEDSRDSGSRKIELYDQSEKGHPFICADPPHATPYTVKFKLTKSIDFVNLNFTVDQFLDQFGKFKLTKSIDLVNLNLTVD